MMIEKLDNVVREHIESKLREYLTTKDIQFTIGSHSQAKAFSDYIRWAYERGKQIDIFVDERFVYIYIDGDLHEKIKTLELNNNALQELYYTFIKNHRRGENNENS